MYFNYMYSKDFYPINEIAKMLAMHGYKVRMKKTPDGFCMKVNASVNTLNQMKKLVVIN